MPLIKNICATVFSIALGLAIIEAGVRALEIAGYWEAPDASAGAVPESFTPFQRLNLQRVYEEHVAPVDGLNREWFLETPKKPEPKPRDAELEVLDKVHRDKGYYSPNAWKLYNTSFFEDYFCNKKPGWTFPDPTFFFGPNNSTPHPFYRFPPNITTPSGLVSNRYGWKGADISIDKPDHTIRIAFLGASTTISGHRSLSYPDFIGHWLNRWADANGHNVVFEIINTGHETYRSMDTAAVVSNQLVHLEPDLAVYYEGANQFRPKREIIGVPTAYLSGPLSKSLERSRFIDTFATLRLILRVLPLFSSETMFADGLRELEKPFYLIRWPDGLDRENPDTQRQDLPLQLSQILSDLNRIQSDLDDIGGELVLTSFIWMVYEGMVVHPVNGRLFFDYTNHQLWPLTYKDARTLADFQNRVFARFAEKNGISFIDVASAFPRELSLFSDTIHMTELGLRLRAWMTIRDLLPVIKTKISSGELPKPDQIRHHSHPVLEQITARFPLEDLKCVSDDSRLSGYRVRVDTVGDWLDNLLSRGSTK